MKKLLSNLPTLFKLSFQDWKEDKASRLSASLAYYTIFSLGPILLIAIAVAGMVWGEEAASGQVSAQLDKVFGENAAEAVETMIAGAAREKKGVFATVIGIAMLLFGASGVFGQLKDALNTIWNVEPKKSAGMIGFIKDRFLSMAMVLGVGFLKFHRMAFGLGACTSALQQCFNVVRGCHVAPAASSVCPTS